MILSIISCNNSQSCKNSSVKAFEEFQLNVKTKDFSKAKRLLSKNENGVYEKYIDTIFNVLYKPTIEFIPEEKDGAYGIKKIGDADLFYAYLKEDNKIFSTIGIMISKNTNCYQIINITKVATSKERNINNDESTLLNKNTYEILGTNHHPTTENYCVLIKNIAIQKDTLQKFADKFRHEYCEKQCNIDLIDNNSAYPLIYKYPLDGADYLLVADHLVASSSFDYNRVQMYPLQDSQYKKLGGNNWKKEPIQSEVKTENNLESLTQKSVETAGAWRIKEECLAAINKSKFSELNKVCNRRDQNALMSMINAGYVKVLNTTDKIEMVDYGFAKSKIKLENGQEYFVANEFITH
jgi:hypothetical protein